MPDSGWTVETLRELVLALLTERDRHYESRFIAQEKAGEVALQSAEKAVLKAEAAVTEKLASMNEFRGQLTDQSKTLLTRSEGELAHAALAERIDEVARLVSDTVPRAEWSAAHERLQRQVAELNDRILAIEGRARGILAGWGYLVAGIGLLATVVTLIILFKA